MLYLSGYSCRTTFELFSRGPNFKSKQLLFECLESVFPFWSSQIGELQPQLCCSYTVQKTLNLKVTSIYGFEHFRFFLQRVNFQKLCWNSVQTSGTLITKNTSRVQPSQWSPHGSHHGRKNVNLNMPQTRKREFKHVMDETTRPVDRPTGWLLDRSTGRLVDWLTGRPV